SSVSSRSVIGENSWLVIIRRPSIERGRYWWSMIFSENQYPPRIKSGAGFFWIMLYQSDTKALACDTVSVRLSVSTGPTICARRRGQARLRARKNRRPHVRSPRRCPLRAFARQPHHRARRRDRRLRPRQHAPPERSRPLPARALAQPGAGRAVG